MQSESVITNEELVELSRRGDNDSLLKLFNRNKPVIDKIITKFLKNNKYRLEKEDLRQESYLVMHRCVLQYKPNKSKFISYYSRAFHNHCFTLAAKSYIIHGLRNDDIYAYKNTEKFSRAYSNVKYQIIENYGVSRIHKLPLVKSNSIDYEELCSYFNQINFLLKDRSKNKKKLKALLRDFVGTKKDNKKYCVTNSGRWPLNKIAVNSKEYFNVVLS